MPKILIVGDLHIPNNKTSIKNSDTFSEIFNTLNLIQETINKYRPEYTIFLGDIFDVPYNISTSVMTIISNILANLALNTNIIMIMGNHDTVNVNNDTVKVGDNQMKYKSSLLSPFRHYNNIIIIDEPSVFKIDNTDIELSLIPYTENVIDSLDKVKNKFSVGTKKICLGHFELKYGYRMILSENNDISVNFPTPEDMVRKYDYNLTLLGHIHDISDFNIDNRLVKYVGSCRNVDFRNTGENKGIYILDTKDLSLEYIDNPYTYIYKTFRLYEDFEKYCTESDEEKLSRTKIHYIYTNSKDMKDLAKIKHFFKSLNFQKSIIDETSLRQNISIESFKEFENAIENNLVTKDKLVDYALQFKEPEDKDEALKILNIITV